MSCLVLLVIILAFFPLRTISAKTISLWQSEFVILSNHLGCLQNFSRWQRFVDKCFVIQVISFSATVAILINWTYDCICQDWKYCHPIWHLLLSELTTTSIVFIKGESLCVCMCSGQRGKEKWGEKQRQIKIKTSMLLATWFVIVIDELSGNSVKLSLLGNIWLKRIVSRLFPHL